MSLLAEKLPITIQDIEPEWQAIVSAESASVAVIDETSINARETAEERNEADDRRIPDELVSKAQDGDELAQAELFSRILPIAYAAARRHEYNDENAADIVQTGLQKVFVNGLVRRQYSGPGNFGSWVYTVVRNTAYDTYRSPAHRRTLPFAPETITSIQERSGAAEVQPSAHQQAESVMDIMERAKIKQTLATPFLLHHIDGYSYNEIAEMMGLKLGTVRSRINRALEQAREYYTLHGRPEIG